MQRGGSPTALDDFIQQVGIVSRSTSVDFGEVRKVAAALDKQVQRDLRMFWKTLATVQPFESLGDVPVGTWPVIVLDLRAGSTSTGIDPLN